MGKPVSIELLFRAQIIDSCGRVRTVHDRDTIDIPTLKDESALYVYLKQVWDSDAFLRELARRVFVAIPETSGPPAADAVETAPRTGP